MSEEASEPQDGQDPVEQARTDEEESLFAGLKRQRDELKLQIHLASQEAKSHWEKIEEKWDEVQDWAEPLTSATKEAAGAAGEQAKKVTGAAMDLAAREISAGYEKLRRLLD